MEVIEMVIEEIAIYVLLLAPVYLAAFAGWALLLLPLAFRSGPKYFATLRKGGLFLGCLFLVGMIFHLLWTAIIFKRFYCSIDYAVDFLPFLPPHPGHVTVPCHWRDHMLTPVPYRYTVVAWFVFAIACWLATVALYRLLQRAIRWTQAASFSANEHAA
jgi:hypothetical protein